MDFDSTNLPARPGSAAGAPDPERDRRATEIRPGAYFQRIDPEGRTALRLLTEVHMVDGEVHSVTLAPDPEEPSSPTLRLMADELLREWAPAPDGAARRQHQHAEAMAEAERARQALERTAAAATLGPEPPALPGPGSTPESVRALVATRRDRAEQAVATMEQATAGLEGAMARVSRFLAEQQAFATAQMSATRAQAERMMRGVETLALYLGDAVELIAIADGEPAASGEPLTLFQRLLYMDEESLINAAFGGADFSDFDDFARMLREDPGLRDRILPTPRAAVAMRFRRRRKDYADRSIIGLLRGAEKNAINCTGFLLIRNGERVHAVFSPIESYQRLFPTGAETDEPFIQRRRAFSGLESSRIGPQDLNYARARSEHERIAVHYRQILVLLAGLFDRCPEAIGMPPGEARSGLGLLSLQAQRDAFSFVADEENVLDDGHPPIDEFFAQKNRYLQPGSRVACRFPEIANAETAPSLYDCDRDYRCVAKVDFPADDGAMALSATGVVLAETHKGQLCLPIPYERRTWRHDTAHGRRLTARIPVSELRLGGATGLHFLCLDAVSLDEAEYYLTNRAARAHYEQYVPLLALVRDRLLAERDALAGPRAALMQAAREGGLDAGEGRIAAAVDDALRIDRAAERGALPPGPDAPAFERWRTGMLNHLWAVLQDPERRIRDVRAWAEARGFVPLRLTVDRAGALVLYREIPPQERCDLLGRHPWVMRQRLDLGLRQRGKARGVHLPEVHADEVVLHDWPAAADWSGLRFPALGYTEVRRLENTLATCASALPGAIFDPLPEQDWPEYWAQYQAFVDADRSTMVHRPFRAYPLGVVHSAEGAREPSAWVICAVWDLERWFAYLCADTEAGRTALHRGLSVYLERETAYKARMAGRDLLGVHFVAIPPERLDEAFATRLHSGARLHTAGTCMGHAPWPRAFLHGRDMADNPALFERMAEILRRAGQGAEVEALQASREHLTGSGTSPYGRRAG